VPTKTEAPELGSVLISPFGPAGAGKPNPAGWESRQKNAYPSSSYFGLLQVRPSSQEISDAIAYRKGPPENGLVT
jgi:hypothetical protein